MCPEGYVYNFGVARHHNYYANGHLVHNCHHVTASTYQKVLSHYPNARSIGLTATPYRLDGSGLGETYQEMVIVATLSDLIASGNLVAPIVYGAQAPDLTGVKTQAGDYQKSTLAAAMDRPHLVGDIVRTWAQHALDRTTVVFAASLEHSRHIVAQFQAAGVTAAHLDADTDPEERKSILRRLAYGEITVVSNYGLLTEGWDLPQCSCCILARPTQSKCLYFQMGGRVLRKADGKTDCYILDHAGNTARHGFLTDPQEFSLAGGVKQSAGPQCKTCPNCYAYHESKETKCIRCGIIFPKAVPQERALIETRDGELQLLQTPTPIMPNASNTKQIETLIKLRSEAALKGYKISWSAIKFRSIFGRFPTSEQVLAAMGQPS
jgi:hypothetical protein